MGQHRAVLDVTAVLNDGFGSNTGAYSDRQLYQQAKRIRPVKYTVEDDDAAPHVERIKLATGTSTAVKLRWNEKYK